MTWNVSSSAWVTVPSHRLWLKHQALEQLDHYRRSLNAVQGGFHDLDDDGKPLPTGWPPATQPQRTLFQTSRMTHCYAIAHLLGDAGAARMVDHGMEYLWTAHRDTVSGGYFWTIGDAGPLNSSKQIYGHAFVLLAASSAKFAGHPDAERLLEDVSSVIDEHFWEEGPGAAQEEFTASWDPLGNYRGANGNMHLVEALLAAGEATGDTHYFGRAVRIAELIIRTGAAQNSWRVPEHYREDWVVDYEYDRDVFRPYGSTVGHWLEWSRLLLQLWVATGRQYDWMPEASKHLFSLAFAEGWSDEAGGFYFTVDWKGVPKDRDRYWWPCAEGIAAAHWLNQLFPSDDYELSYRTIWQWAAQHLIDGGSWRHQLDDSLRPISNPWFGRPDIYHSFQASLIPLLPAEAGLAATLVDNPV